MKMVTQSLFTVLFFALFAINTITPVSAQVISKADLAKQLLQARSSETKLGADELSSMKVSSETYSNKSGVTHIYFQQFINEIPVHGAILNAHVTRDNKLLTVGNRFVPLADARIKGNAQPSLTAEQALRAALKSLEIKENGVFIKKSEENNTVRLTVFDRGLIAIEDIKVQLVYQPVDNKQQGIRLAWQVEIYTSDAQNWWLARMDAETGELLDKNNYVAQCNFGITNPAECGHIHTPEAPHQTYFDLNRDSEPSALMNSPLMVLAPSQYKVYPQPYESPNHMPTVPPADGRVLITDPANLTASPFGWHDTDGVDGAEFTTTQGNNVHAYTDINADNLPDAGSSPDGGASLVFDFPINLTQPPSTYRPAAVTNLFYWNNYMHDFAYLYGFDEVSGNFQVNNYGNGGLGNDDVRAEAQDGSGTNNANFATPADGSRPRMQMYVGTNPDPDIDGDMDNGVIAHEYAHGISNRLTGGPSTASCLSNQEQMGEGWSDFYALMTTLEPGDAGIDSRGIGTYLFGEPANGPGIRPTPYSTDMTINPATYNTIITAVAPHGVGYVWCGMIWDLTWAMIDDHGQGAGFDVAMNLVNEGMKLQPCSPGFVDGRDAILAADLALYGGANSCRIWEVFARRGLGFSANQGSSGSKIDGTEAFDTPNFCTLDVTPVMGSVCAPANAVYTVTNGTTDVRTLSATGNPAGTTISFSVNPIPANGTSTMTVSNTGAAIAGSYTVTVTGTGSVNVLTKDVSLIIQTGPPAVSTLVSPANLAVGQINPLLTWDVIASAETYEVEIATDGAFTNVIISATGLVNPSYQTIALTNLTTYYWRSRGVNACGNGDYSAAFSFTTANIICNTYASTDVPVSIPTTVATITSTLIIPGCGGTISDLNVLGLNIAHTWIDDLVIDLTSPEGTTVRLMNRPCGSENDILINFDDEAASPTFPCPPVDNGYYQPFAPLTAFDGENLAGTWTLTVADVLNLDGGSLNGWSLEICYGPELVAGITSSDADNTICEGESVTFTGSGGTMYEFFVDNISQGSASTTNTFTTSSLTNGQKVKVTVSNGSGCSATSGEITITVNTLPTVTCPGNISVCSNALPFELNGALPVGGVYTGTGVNCTNLNSGYAGQAYDISPVLGNAQVVGNIFDPSCAGVGDHIITYTYTDGICTNTCNFTISVYEAPVITSATPGCDGGAGTGSITVNATLSAGTIEYSINNTDWQAGNIFSTLANSIYTVYVRNQSHPECVTSMGGVGVNCDVSNNCITFTASITSADPTIPLRPFRDGEVKTCSAPGSCQDGLAGTFNYQIFEWTNSVAQCVTVTYTATNASFAFVTVYDAPPVPGNTCTNWVTDAGSSAADGQSIVFSFDASAGTTYYFLVNNVGITPSNCTIQISAPDCSVPPTSCTATGNITYQVWNNIGNSVCSQQPDQ